MDSNLFSIVIPCKNEEAYIGKALRSIRFQNIITPGTPVFIADANSGDKTLQIVNSFSETLNIKIITGGLPPVARNNGARLCTSEYILFMDADMELAGCDSLKKVLDLAEREQLELVIPRILISEANGMDRLFEYTYYFAAKSKIFGAFGAGMFIFIRNETFKALGGFNENLPLGDDWELTHQISPGRFALADACVYTTNRRFMAQGYFQTFYQWTSVAFRKNYRHQLHTEYFDKTYARQKN